MNEKISLKRFHIFSGLEKLNDLTTKEYQYATNKRSDYVKQILRRRARVCQLSKNTLKKVVPNALEPVMV